MQFVVAIQRAGGFADLLLVHAEPPMPPHCARCKRRNVISYTVPEEIKRLVLVGRWKAGVCASCFDELAEQAGIRYSFEEVSAVSWCNMPAPRTSPRRRR
jgi:hypothetical protein